MTMGLKRISSRSSLTKEAVGQRQVKRILDALPSLKFKPSQIRDRLNYGGEEAVRSTFSAAPGITPGGSWSGAHTIEDLQSARRAVLKAKTPGERAQARQARDALQAWHDPRTEAQLTSGRHTRKDVVDIAQIGKAKPGGTKRTEGFNPKEVAYRGGDPAKDTRTYGLEPDAKDPRWFTGEPSVAAVHAREPSQTLRAYPIKGIDPARKGPWTQHIGTDPRSKAVSMTPPVEKADALPIYSSPFYEKVIDAQSIPEVGAVYKSLPTANRFQRVMGPNVLRGEGISEVVTKHAAVPVLPKDQEFLDEHFSIDPQWTSFQKNLRSKSFAEAARQDTRTDPKLKRFVKMIGLRQQDRSKGVPAPGDGNRDYKIKYHPEVGRFSCSCPDWTYKRSVKNKGPSGDCKHIKRMKSSTMKKMASLGPMSTILRAGVVAKQEAKRNEQAQAFKIRDEAYKRHFPRQGLISSFLKKAALRGAAARSLLEG